MNGDSVRLEAVGLTDSRYYDQSLSLDQFTKQVAQLQGSSDDSALSAR